MDAAGLTILLREPDADVEVLRDAAERVAQESPGHLEAAAYEIGRFYNVLERAMERVCEAFENHFEKRRDYHEKLLQRLSLDIPGIRPAFLPAARLATLRELKGFRHVCRHAYDVVLRRDRLSDLADAAKEIAHELPGWLREFSRSVRAEQGWSDGH